MGRLRARSLFFLFVVSLTLVGLTGCGAQPGTNIATTNSNSNINTNANSGSSNSSTTATSVEAKEPEQYQATVSLKLEALGTQQTTSLPTISANVARKGTDRRMEFTIPAGGKVVYLDKGETKLLLLPDKKQYAELNQESVGFEIRRMLMPEQIVNQVKSVKGVERVGEEKYNGRDVIKYRYGAVANTQTQAGQVTTESYMYVDKETGLPLHSETVSQSQSGGNVQGYSGLRMITEITDVKTGVGADLFEQPAGYTKIDAAQVRAQVELVFNVLAAVLAQTLKPQPANTSASPVR